MRTLLMIGSILAAATATARGQDRVASDFGGFGSPAAPSTLSLLNERVKEVALQEAPLDQVLEWIAELTPLSVVVRWQELESVGVERDQPISLQIHNLRLSQVLWLILREAGGADVRLAFRADHELLTISTGEDFDGDMLVKVYPAGDLLIEAPRIADHGRIDISRMGAGSPQSGLSSPGESGREGGSAGHRDPEQRAEQLIELIAEAIEPDSWASNGGRGTIQAWGSLLVVRNSIRVHQALGGYLEEAD